MAVTTCNADDREGRCDADDGLPCSACEAQREADMRYWFGWWQVASPEEKDPDKYREEMREAGRWRREVEASDCRVNFTSKGRDT